jgi:glycosyltransferase involved in cell wall biosynthesis
MTKIAFFSKLLPSDSPNGVSVQVHRCAQALVERGHALTLFSFSPKPPDARYDHVQIEWGNSSRFFRKFLPATKFRNIPLDQFDIVHYHGDDYLCHGSVKRIRTFYGSALQEALHAVKAGRFFYQALFYLFEWVSCCKKGTCTGISVATSRSLPLVKNIIPCCVPLSHYTPPERKCGTPSILFIGDLDSRKRGRLVLDIFSKEIFPVVPDVILTVVGPQACSGDGVRYAGIISEQALIEEYRNAWVYCMASSYEGFGVPAIEATACGAVVVATDNCGIKEIITHGVNGMICTPQKLGTTILQVLRDMSLRKMLRYNGMDLVKSYDCDLIAQRYEQLYDHMLQKQCLW